VDVDAENQNYIAGMHRLSDYRLRPSVGKGRQKLVRGSESPIPAALMIDPCPGEAGDGIDALGIPNEEVPSMLVMKAS
jgi:hypothetical protein